MDYVAQWNYANYLIEMDNLDRRMSRSIQEALILSEGVDVANRFDLLQEGVVDKVKNIWNGLVRTIKNIFAKMVNGINAKLDDVKTYLTNYREFILNRPYKLEGVRMKNYQPDRIAKVHLEQFQFDNMKQMDGNTAYMKHYIQTYNGDGTDLGTWTKAYFCGGSEDMVDINSLNMTDLYNFCMDWENKTKKELAADQSAVIKSADNVRNLIAQAEQNAKSEQIAQQKAEDEQKKANQNSQQQAQSAQAAGNPQGGGTPEVVNGIQTKKGEVGGASFRYSDLYKSTVAITEIEIPAQQKASSGGNSGGGNSTPTTPSPAATKFSSNVGGVKGDAETSDTATAAYNDGKTYEAVEKAVDIYKNVTGAIAAAKITVCEDMFNDYYAIIKAHVKMYVGDDKAEKTATQTGTDYRSLGLPDPNTLKPGTIVKDKKGLEYIVTKAKDALTGAIKHVFSRAEQGQ